MEQNIVKENYLDYQKEGWISIYRVIRKDPIWTCERFSKAQAWIDLLIRANHCDVKKNWYGDKKIKRGQVYTSKEQLANDWKWDRKTVSSFLKNLETRGSVKLVSDKTGTIITILNYDKYQQNRMDIPEDKPTDMLEDKPTDMPEDKPTDMLEDELGEGYMTIQQFEERYGK